MWGDHLEAVLCSGMGEFLLDAWKAFLSRGASLSSACAGAVPLMDGSGCVGDVKPISLMALINSTDEAGSSYLSKQVWG